MKTLSQRGKASREKGKRFERWVKNALKDIFPEAKRGWQSRGGTSEEQDIEGTPFAIECKHRLTVNIRQALDQADMARYRVTETETKQVDFRPPVACTKCQKGLYANKVLVTMKFDDWKELVRMAYSE